MHPTLSRQTAALANSISNLLPKKLPPTLSAPENANLYELLSRAPGDVKGKEVHQLRWTYSGKSNSYWKITDARFKCGGKHGKAWGILYMSGKQINEEPKVIRTGLKYTWGEGRSTTRIVPSTSAPKVQAKPKRAAGESSRSKAKSRQRHRSSAEPNSSD
ncbi:hypothetical protein NP233_g7407 [Leucocoprinus birnbaumii]|uniref:Uncharacterized protein n=1 Tax=Leucocoprinus birnbaumii TaxID=56174 RepID=A0AAD5VP95_9AGAR|nr:hypothetical protein NP233_g7407 [Leucocoprinus birnbaumii]